MNRGAWWAPPNPWGRRPDMTGLTEHTHTHLAYELGLPIRRHSQSVVICGFDLYLWRRHLTSHTVKRDKEGPQGPSAGALVDPHPVQFPSQVKLIGQTHRAVVCLLALGQEQREQPDPKARRQTAACLVNELCSSALNQTTSWERPQMERMPMKW